MVKIYTKTGDKGETSLCGADRVKKNNIRVEAYGTVDELCSFVGFARSSIYNTEIKEMLLEIEHVLLKVSGDLSSPLEDARRTLIPKLTGNDIEFLEKKIDSWEKELPKLTEFIMTGGEESSSRLHLCRVICRRAERKIVSLNEVSEINSLILAYVNRLSDFFFTLARYLNFQQGKEEIVWKNQKSKKLL